mgnify:CR=1 FL=1|jgi:hypothetical protein
MNKTERTDLFFYLKNLFFPPKERKVESISASEESNNDRENKDKFLKNKEKRYYGKRRKNYSDY